MSMVVFAFLSLSLWNTKEASAQVLNQEVQRLLQNTCRGLGLPGNQSAITLQQIGFGRNLANICGQIPISAFIGPGSGGGTASLQGSAVSVLNRNLLRRLEEIRDEEIEKNSSQSASVARLLPAPFGGLAPTSLQEFTGLTQNQVGAGNVSPFGFSSTRWHGLGLFATGQAEILNRTIGIFQDGFSSNIFGFTAGADYRFSKTFVAGAAFTYANTNGEFTQGGTFSTNAYTLSLFASYLPTERTFLQVTGEQRRTST